MKYVLLASLASIFLYPAAEKEKQSLSNAQFPICKTHYRFSPTDKPSKYRTAASAQWVADQKKNTMTITVTPAMAQEMAAYVNEPKTPEGQWTKPFNHPPKSTSPHRPDSVLPLKLSTVSATDASTSK